MTDQNNTFPKERTAVVTGCGTAAGIGRPTARQLAANGYSIAAVDINPDVHDFADELQKEYPGLTVQSFTVDISDEDAVVTMFSEISHGMPPVVGLANVAGIACPTPLESLSASELTKVLSINVTGTMLMMREASALMRASGVGRIVNFSSITALDGGGTFSKIAYAAAKAGVIGLTRGGARELGPCGVTCNAICPGPIDTEIMGGKLTDDRKAAMSSDIPVGRVGQPEEVAQVVAFLLSAHSSFVNGVAMNVDGGKYMH